MVSLIARVSGDGLRATQREMNDEKPLALIGNASEVRWTAPSRHGWL